MRGRRSAQVVFSGKVFDVVRGTGRLPNGRLFTHEHVHFPKVAMMIPVLGDKIILIREYRTSVKRWLTGIPAGKVDKNESPLQAAKREMEEETGFVADDIKFLFKSYGTPGYSDELRYAYLVKCGAQKKQHTDKDEVINVMPVALSKALSMIESGRIIDGKTIMALLYYDKFVNPEHGKK